MTLNVLITGANRGIGLALSQYYLNKGYHVYAACRSSSDELNASSATVISDIDICEHSAINKLTESLADNKIDILINNAGILYSETLRDIDKETVLKQFEVNALAPLKLTEALLDHLAPQAKVALITSRMGSMSDNSSGGYYGYRMSKAALNAAGVSLAQDLKPKGIAVAILHPGFVQTDMVNHAGDISANTAAERLAQRIDELTIESSGSFWHSNGDKLPW